MILAVTLSVSVLILLIGLRRVALKQDTMPAAGLVVISLVPLLAAYSTVKAVLVWLALMSLAGAAVVVARGLAAPRR